MQSSIRKIFAFRKFKVHIRPILFGLMPQIDKGWKRTHTKYIYNKGGNIYIYIYIYKGGKVAESMQLSERESS